MARRGDGALEYAERRRRRRAGSAHADNEPSTPASPGSPIVLREGGEEADWSADLRKKVRRFLTSTRAVNARKQTSGAALTRCAAMNVCAQATILRYMSGKLDATAAATAADAHATAAPAGAEDGGGGSPGTHAAAPHVRAWARSRHAAVFKLSTRAVQLQFSADASQLLLLPDGRAVWFHSGAPGAAASLHDLGALPSGASGEGAALLSRLRYARKLLARLAVGDPPGGAAEDSLEL
jgi:hypothetical protein